METHSSILAWRIPWTEEPGGLQSMGSQSQTRLSDHHSLTDIYTIEYYSAIRPSCWERLKAGGEGDDRG